ncbi:MAG: pyridoxine 5'-phosphate synthase [Pirellulales bacterium]
MAALLSVNLNAIAALRNRRNLPWPSVERFGKIALDAGAHGLTVHPRPDQRHIRFSDIPVLRELTRVNQPYAEFNIEGYPSNDFLELVEAHQPDQVTLVPDSPEQNTSDHGWDCIRFESFLSDVVERLHKRVKRVSLFCDPDADRQQIEAAARTGADRIELYTGPYGATYSDPRGAEVELSKLERSGLIAQEVGLAVNAGHDLTVDNLPGLAQAVPHLAEVSIGHALIADALEFGMSETVRRFIRAC